jgi:membrane peptidoglycan carboxypeptidase
MAYEYYPTVKALYDDATIKVNDCSRDTFVNNSIALNNNQDKYLTFNDIPLYVKDAFIAIEDRNFYNHGGISAEAIFRACYSFIVNGGKITQGGSTITQQLARNVFLNFDKDYKRKIEEMFIAIKLEQKFTKNQILEFYINNINYSNGAYGIEAAAEKYFNKAPKDLNLSQICFLAAIPNDPTYYNPLKHSNNTLQRRDLILKAMKENNYITEAQYESAINFKIELAAYNN